MKKELLPSIPNLLSRRRKGRAVRCPVCFGKGTLPNDGQTTDASPKKCHGCYGKGWITVYDG